MEFLASLISPENLEYFLRLFVALIFGLILGTERVFAKKTAGMRTYALVSMGSALFVLISQIISEQYTAYSFDPLRMASQVVVGLGFIGAGIIIFRDAKVRGLTTATGLWVSGGIGIASGYALYEIAFFATFLTLFVFSAVWFVEQRFKKFFDSIDDDSL